jgi:hypothetical protein
VLLKNEVKGNWAWRSWLNIGHVCCVSNALRMHSKAELKLMVRYPLAFPALNLSYNSIMSKET